MRRGFPGYPSGSVGRGRRAFTLIELLVAAALAALLMMTAIPFAREARKDPLVRAVNTLVDGCREARLKAILKDRPMQVVIFENGASVGVEPVPDQPLAWRTTAAPVEANQSTADSSPEKPVVADAKRIDDEVAFRQLLVNGRDMMASDAAVIRFFPNGTSDALTAELQWLRRGLQRVSLDIMTGQPIVEALP